RLWFFHSAGTLVASAGRRGAGPGGYQRIYSVHRLEGDTILGEDIELRRFTFYMPDGRLVRTERFADEIPMAAPVVGRLPGGSWLHQVRSWVRSSQRVSIDEDTVRVNRYSPGGRLLASIGPFRGMRR